MATKPEALPALFRYDYTAVSAFILVDRFRFKRKRMNCSHSLFSRIVLMRKAKALLPEML